MAKPESVCFMVPFEKLEVHPENVRTIDVKDGVNDLAANIKINGLLNPLTVVPGGSTNQWFVVAGQRRLAAIGMLIKDKVFEANYQVACCEAMPGIDPVMASASENLMRMPMRPVDQYRAFAHMHDAGHTVEEIAQAFGIKPHQVRQQMVLGNLAPEILSALDAGKIDIDMAKALSLTTDHKKQRELMKRKNTYAHQVRSILLERKFPASSAAFDLALYKGDVLADLFGRNGARSDDMTEKDVSESWLVDFQAALDLQIIAGNELAKRLQDEGHWEWVKFEPTQMDTHDLGEYAKLFDHRRWSDKRGRYEDQIEKYTKKEQAASGVLIYLDHDWRLEILAGVGTKEQAKAVKKAAAKGKGKEEAVEEVKQKVGSPDNYSGTLSQTLQFMRHNMRGAQIATHPMLAQRLLLASLIAGEGMGTGAFSFRLGKNWSRADIFEQISRTSWGKSQAQETEKFEKLRPKLKNDEAIIAYVTGLKDEQVLEMVAFFLGSAFNGPFDYDEMIDKATKSNIRKEWTPDDKFFGLFSKGELAWIEKKVGIDKGTTDRHLGLKKTEMASALSGIFADPKKQGFTKQAVIDKIKGWLPPNFTA